MRTISTAVLLALIISISWPEASKAASYHGNTAGIQQLHRLPDGLARRQVVRRAD